MMKTYHNDPEWMFCWFYLYDWSKHSEVDVWFCTIDWFDYHRFLGYTVFRSGNMKVYG